MSNPPRLGDCRGVAVASRSGISRQPPGRQRLAERERSGSADGAVPRRRRELARRAALNPYRKFFTEAGSRAATRQHIVRLRLMCDTVASLDARHLGLNGGGFLWAKSDEALPLRVRPGAY